MKSLTNKLAAFLVDPRSMMFGVGIFTLFWACLDSLDFRFPSNLFLAVLLLAASILIQLNTRWSNLIAAILSGYLPLEFVRAFWMYPRLAEVPTLSAKHFHYFFANLPTASGFMMFMAVTLMMLTRSVYAIIHNSQSEDRAS
jgi:hypothetical protein